MNGDSSSRPWVSQQAFIPLLVAGGASVLGLAIALGNWLYLALLVALAAIPVVVRWPVQTSLGVYAFLIPFDPILALGGKTTGPTITRLVGVGAAAVLLATGLIGRRLVRPPQAALWWILFIFWGALSAVWAVDTEEVLLRLPTAVSLLLLYLVAVSVNVSEKELSSIYFCVILGGIVASASTIYLYQSGILYEGSGRASLVFGERQVNPEDLSFSLVLPIALAAYSHTISLRLWKKMLYMAAITIMAAGFFLTMARGPLLGLVIFFLAYSIISRGSKKLTISLIPLALMLLIMPERFFTRWNLMKDPGAGRLVIWQVGWSLVQDYWIMGAGLSNYSVVEYRLIGTEKGAHNIFLTSLVELGVIGLLFLLLALWCNIRQFLSSMRPVYDETPHRDKWLGAGHLIGAVVLGLLVAALFHDDLWRKAFWFPLMLIILTWHSQKSNG